ncbi:MAG TPA: tetratricopeptide repeat protein [Candidatus Eisenbacteria bacterium]|nr:tetratricopeptide repeat protein [Candidatus Eisenbacteria bacterium]
MGRGYLDGTKIAAAGLLALVFGAPPARAAAPCEPWVARLVSAQGAVEVRRTGQTQWLPTRYGDTYCAGDQIQVGERSRADVALINQPILRLDQNSTITLGGLRDEGTSIIDLLRGALYFFSRTPRNLEVRTPFVNAGVEGTEGLIRVETNRTVMSIFEGTVSAVNPAGRLAVTGGQSAVAEQGRAPALVVVVRPREAVQWTLYYPPALHFRAEEFPPGLDWQGMVRTSIEALNKGELQAAFDSIKGVPDTVTDPRFFIYRAALLLTVGRLEQATEDIERALNVDPVSSDALALQAVIAVAQNQEERAVEVANKAVTADARSPAALVALSYARQARFDLDGALSALEQAVQVAPENPLGWARLAEMRLSLGRLEEALVAAQRAAVLNPNLSRTQTVLGFARLTQIEREEAERAFERAIELDQADPLPRLGLGLGKIRNSDLGGGRREIEIAASLDPSNATVRSYLGKAYFEEKRDDQAAAQYEIAKALDPRDPTAYFYDAILKQTTNRPVEALGDMQKAIELNDNRAVYRSRLLLDSDLAARSAALGRIYSDLGFQQLALVEGWKSVNTDPANFSAHRLLADSYSVLPRHEIARVSELLQSQLLQPLNMTPIQPRLAESDLFLIGAAGPVALSFNEFHSLFSRNGINFQTTGLAGENSTYSGEGIVSGIYKKFSFSLGGFHFQSDGWRRNADQRDAIANAFLQAELTPKTSVQAEFRHRDFERGDLQVRVFPQDAPDERERIDSFTVRLGGRHSFSPDSILLGSFIFQDRNTRTRSLPLDAKLPQSAISFELQHLYRSRRFNLTSGIGYFDIDDKLDLRLGPVLLPSTKQDVRHLNAHVYANMHVLKNVTLTAGSSLDYLDGEHVVVPGGDEAQFNPKFGVTWIPLSGTAIRAAVSRVLKRTLITDQTLEPTQVAGFNQFFDDVDVTEAWRYGAAIDQKFSESVFGGLEFAKRDLKIPLIDTTTLTTQRLDGEEYLARAYGFWAPRPWFAATAEYMFERFANDGRLLARGEPRHSDTHRWPLGIRIFHPSGISAAVRAAYYHQSGRFSRPIGLQSATNNFWTVDAALQYRLPNRHGFVTVGATNLFDRRFKFFDSDRDNPHIQPDRMFFFRLTLALP